MQQKLFIHNRKKQKISVVINTSSNQQGLVFIMHGLGGFKEQLHLNTIAETFKEEKFTTVLFDTTNSVGESDGSYQNATLTNYYEDLEDVIIWAGKQEFYQQPFYLVGHSLGGISVTLFAERNPKLIKGLAAFAPVVSGTLFVDNVPKEQLEYWDKTGWQIRESKSKGITLKLNWQQFKKDILNYDLLEKANKLTMPVLIIVGEKDTSTPVEHQQKLFDKIPGKKELCIIKDAPHTFVKEEHLKQLRTIFKKWINKTQSI